MSYILRFFSFFKSKKTNFFILCVILSFLFFRYASNIAFNDKYIFITTTSKLIALAIFWSIILMFFFIKFIYKILTNNKDEIDHKKEIAKESKKITTRAKRNFFISIKDAKNTWKKSIKFNKIPLAIMFGYERAGKSAFINYANIEYPISEFFESYKKLHPSTTNFSLYISKDGAIVDTEGIGFSRENLYNPTSTDEIAEDDMEKNRDFLLKKRVWEDFLSFLNKNIFRSKLDAAILVIDIQKFIENSKSYQDELIKFLVKRVSECENRLKTNFPIYVVFSKIDLITGMGEYFKIFKSEAFNKAFGITFKSRADISLAKDELKTLSKAMSYSLMSKNTLFYSIDDKKSSYLFYKQMDFIFNLVDSFIQNLNTQNSLKNRSFIRGVYFTSSYQENVPKNSILEAICAKYEIKQPLIKPSYNYTKKSYFTNSLLKDIIFKDSITKKRPLKVINIAFSIFLCFCIGLASFAILQREKSQSLIANNSLNNIATLLESKDYNELSDMQKIELLKSLRENLEVFPRLFSSNSKFEYLTLDTSYKGFLPAKALYQKLTSEFFNYTILTTMQEILKTEKNPNDLIQTLYMYEMLFDKRYLNTDLFKLWIEQNWDKFKKYGISKNEFLSYADIISTSDLKDLKKDEYSLNLAMKNLSFLSDTEKLFYILEFIAYKNKIKLYDINDEIPSLNQVLNDKIKPFSSIYTKSGLVDFLLNMDKFLDEAADVHRWLFNSSKISSDINLKFEIVELYLKIYEDVWISAVDGILPKQQSNQQNFLNELKILSSDDSPIFLLAKNLSYNTKMSDEENLKFIYSLGYPSIKTKEIFASFDAKFKVFHDLSDANNTKFSDISLGISKIHKKISDYNYESFESKSDKIRYIFSDIRDENDPFVVFEKEIKDLPNTFYKYYKNLTKASWLSLKTSGIELLNSSWQNSVYSTFINDIKPYYPFNKNSKNQLNMQTFKNFFGRNGDLDLFFNSYLKDITVKTKNGYELKQGYKSGFKLNGEFVRNYNRAILIRNSLLSQNSDLKINYRIRAIDLSGIYSNIKVSNGSKVMIYDHTIPSVISINSNDFDASKEISFIANYHNGKIDSTIYSGEWAWYELIDRADKKEILSIYFNEKERYYFGFEILPNTNEIYNLINLIQNFTLPRDIME